MSQYIESSPPLFVNVIGECWPLRDDPAIRRLGELAGFNARHDLAELQPNPRAVCDRGAAVRGFVAASAARAPGAASGSLS